LPTVSAANGLDRDGDGGAGLLAVAVATGMPRS